jgi:hypothetical protein
LEGKAGPGPGTRSLADQIVILGIEARSGTNFLYHLVSAHPGCRPPDGPFWENHLTRHLDVLAEYAEAVYRHWQPEWEVDKRIGPPDVLLECIGDGLTSFLNLRGAGGPAGPRSPAPDDESSPPAPPRRLVTKTPSVAGLRSFLRVFPRAQLLLIVRDGRSVVESGIRSFNWDHEQATRNWAAAARAILDFDRENGAEGRRYLIVRYEDLHGDTERELRRIFAFLGLAADAYDFEGARRLPVYGSSELARLEGKVHWEPVRKEADFDPVRRWRDWSDARHDRFVWIAGKYLSAFGYPAQIRSGSRPAWAARNTVLDLSYWLRRLSRGLVRLSMRASVRALRGVGLGALPRRLRTAAESVGVRLPP